MRAVDFPKMNCRSDGRAKNVQLRLTNFVPFALSPLWDSLPSIFADNSKRQQQRPRDEAFRIMSTTMAAPEGRTEVLPASGEAIDLHELAKGWKAAIARGKDPATR